MPRVGEPGLHGGLARYGCWPQGARSPGARRTPVCASRVRMAHLGDVDPQWESRDRASRWVRSRGWNPLSAAAVGCGTGLASHSRDRQRLCGTTSPALQCCSCRPACVSQRLGAGGDSIDVCVCVLKQDERVRQQIRARFLDALVACVLRASASSDYTSLGR